MFLINPFQLYLNLCSWGDTGRGEGLETDLITSGQWFDKSCLCSETSILNKKKKERPSWCTHWIRMLFGIEKPRLVSKVLWLQKKRFFFYREPCIRVLRRVEMAWDCEPHNMHTILIFVYTVAFLLFSFHYRSQFLGETHLKKMLVSIGAASFDATCLEKRSSSSKGFLLLNLELCFYEFHFIKLTIFYLCFLEIEESYLI